MQWPTPNSISELYDTLKDIFVYYRIHKTIFEVPKLEDLELTRLEYIKKTPEQIQEQAHKLVNIDIEKLKLEKIGELESRITECEIKMDKEHLSCATQVEKITTLYKESQEKLERQVVENGLLNSTILIDKITTLEDSKNKEIALIISKRDSMVTTYQAKKSALEYQLNNLDEFFSSVYNALKEKKIEELTEEDEKLEMDIFKYNNGLDEKEQRYKNSKIQAEASLDLKYKELRAAELSKDELVELGYYKDVINCVTGYFDQFDVEDGYQLFKNEANLVMYLDDFYQQLLYLYKTRQDTQI